MNPKHKIIHETTDYSLFKTIEGNRTKNVLHTKRLKKSMEKQYLFTVIVVNEKYEIIDGQHRFEIIKELGLPLFYVICENYRLKEVQLLNQNSKTWNTEDYLEGFCNLGNANYLEYKKFRKKYKFGHNECMAMLTGGTVGGGNLGRKFKVGGLVVTHLDNATEKAERIYELSSYYKGFMRRSFVYAMLKLLNKKQFVFTEFLKKLSSQKSVLVDCATAEQYLSVIENIYNHRRSEKVSLRY